MKTVTIQRRIIISGTAVSILSIILAIAVYFLLNAVMSSSRTVFELDDSTIFLKQRLVDHLTWVSQLEESIITERAFSGQTDPTKCKFGSWYYDIKNAPAHDALSPQRRLIFDGMEKNHDRLHASAVKINAARSLKAAAAIFSGETKPAVQALQEEFNRYVALNQEEADASHSRAVTIASRITIALILLAAAIVALAAFFVYRLVTLIARAIRNLEETIFTLTRGDLVTSREMKKVNCSELKNCGKTDCAMYGTDNNSCFVDAGSYATLLKNEVTCPSILNGKYRDCRECPVMGMIAPDELSFLEVLLDHFRGRIRHLVKNISDMIFSLASATEEMSATAGLLAESSQNQAASAEEVTAAIEEVSAAIDNIAQSSNDQFTNISALMSLIHELSKLIEDMGNRTKESTVLTEKIAVQAHAGSQTIESMNESIAKIGASSGDMKNIVSIINDISDKINLLSLNAAIEAARAGDAGRGFAVVADEISKLADQTAQSIKEIGSLIRGNDEEIVRGTDNVRASVETISQIIDGVGVVSEFFTAIYENMKRELELNGGVNTKAEFIKTRSDEIRIATEEQKSAFTEITRSVSNINQMTQNNASSSEEMSGNSEEIAGMAEMVRREIEFFKLD